MHLRYNYRIYPTRGQRIALARAFGCARVVFNDGLSAREAARAAGLSYITDAELSRMVITRAKRTPERAWLGEVSAVVLQQALMDLNTAYNNYFDSIKGKRKGSEVGRPRYRSRKDHRQAIRFTRNARFAITPGCKLRLPKIGDIQVRWSRDLPDGPSSVTIIKDSSGRYFASFVVALPDCHDGDGGGTELAVAAVRAEPPAEELPGTGTELGADVGIDLGLTHFAVLSDGTKIGNPKWLRRRERKLKRAQRALTRKKKGSKNREKARVRVARQHARVADARRDFHHQLSTWLIRDNQAVYVEDLSVKGLARSSQAKGVHDAGWSQFVAMLEHKSHRYGRVFSRIARGFPSSQICSACSRRDGHKSLKVRHWVCPGCGAALDRDVNAALNVLQEGRRITEYHSETANKTDNHVAAGRQAAPAMVRGAETLNACGDPLRPPFVVAVVVEAGTRQKPKVA